MSYQVFISYSSHDVDVAKSVRDALEQEGLRCWMAPRDLTGGAHWAEGIVDAIRVCDVLVLIFSRHSNQSEYVANEVCLGVGHNCWIIPYRVEEILPAGDLQFFLCRSHWLNAFPEGPERSIDALCRTVRDTLARGRPGPRGNRRGRPSAPRTDPSCSAWWTACSNRARRSSA